ncbi:gliding motility lipoprotein GldH [Dysgonomonas macrotermitis]|uniref:Gliding motility-associated lipoprotein GldH n=1 Tax=Dysgonomonas macrotermitis TaxID=1346286 RepID=A0A1M4ZVR5_9BACT|nr:gliding motility lipoprotein GldH [Dysgonomonas macrotermitis]SHF22143.1 gliding motility-associated lipoprotein GldH [Dysgonomonas macrotermitis]
MKDKVIYITAIIMSLICLSCNQREAYYQFIELPDVKWSRFDTITFEVDSAAVIPGIPYDVNLEIVNTADYEYQNIWLYTKDNFSKRDFIAYEIEYALVDDKGNWHGSGFGSIYQVSVVYKRKLIFDAKRNYTLKIVQGMRDEPLSGIEKIGVKIVPSE